MSQFSALCDLRLGSRSGQTQVDLCKPRSVTYRSRSDRSRLPTHRSYMDPNHGLTLIYRSYGSVGQTYIILYLSLHIFEDKIAILFKQTKWYNFIENISIIELKSNLLDLFTPYCFEQYVHMHKLLFTTTKNAQNKKNSLLICTNLC